MKKILLLFIPILLASTIVNAQFSVTTDGNQITDGQTFQFSSLTAPEANLGFTVENTGSEEISMRIEVLSFDNTDGVGMELCFGTLCYNGVQPGNLYPVNELVVIQPGETQSGAGIDHFLNTEGNGSEIITYQFQFQQLDDEDNIENTLDVIYQYDPNLAIGGKEKDLGVTLTSTQISSGQLSVNNERPLTMQIYSLLGKQIKTTAFESGLNTVDVSNLSSGVYLVRFQNEQGQTNTQKFVIE